jgi:hypothetical protein
MRFSPSVRMIACAVVVLYLAICTATIHSLRPWCDEAYNGGAAMNLVNYGHMGVPAIEIVSAESYPGIDRHWYWQMPFYPVALAGWFELTGQGLYQQRFFTLFQACIVLLCTYLIIRRLSGQLSTAIGAVIVLALDYFFVQRSCDGRYDMLCAGCGFAGLAAYVCLRERSAVLAVLLGSAGVVGAVMTHAIGVLFGAQLLYLFVRYDLRRIRWSWVPAALAPPLVAGLLWGMYIQQDPAAFRGQFLRSIADRGGFTKDPIGGVRREVQNRYIFGLGGVDGAKVDSGLRSIRVIVLAGYLAGMGVVFASRRLRSKLAMSPILHLWAIGAVVLLVMDSGTRPLYLVHALPWMAAMVAASCIYLWTEFPTRRYLLAGTFGIFLAVQLAGIAYVIRRNNWRSEYTPVVQYLQQHLKSGQVVMGSPEYGFALGFGKQLVDDPCLGYFSKKIPTYIVLDLRYADQIRWYKDRLPEVYNYIQQRITADYTMVESAGLAKVYQLKSPNVVN